MDDILGKPSPVWEKVSSRSETDEGERIDMRMLENAANQKPSP